MCEALDNHECSDSIGARRGSQKKRWEDNIKEWTGMEFGDFLRAAEDRKWWKGIVAMSSVVSRRPPRLRRLVCHLWSLSQEKLSLSSALGLQSVESREILG